jgi:hypothetical protein
VISPTQTPDNTQHSQETSMPLAVFEPAIPTSERPQTHALDRLVKGLAVEEYDREETLPYVLKSTAPNEILLKTNPRCSTFVYLFVYFSFNRTVIKQFYMLSNDSQQYVAKDEVLSEHLSVNSARDVGVRAKLSN